MKIQIKSIWGDVLFEYEQKDNTVKDTLLAAIKSRANLSRANLSRADLYGADLYGANLSGADLYGANLSRANLYGANLSRANLSRADLYGADLYGANLSGADLSRANLYGANLSRANLSRANLSRANLSRADLSRAKEFELVIARTRILPDGDLIGYKKCRDGVIVKLLIPKEAKRSHAFGRKCRAEFAQVLELSTGEKAYSTEDREFEYVVGQTVRPTKPFDENWMEECSTGIHFFITRIEAEKY